MRHQEENGDRQFDARIQESRPESEEDCQIVEQPKELKEEEVAPEIDCAQDVKMEEVPNVDHGER